MCEVVLIVVEMIGKESHLHNKDATPEWEKKEICITVLCVCKIIPVDVYFPPYTES